MGSIVERELDTKLKSLNTFNVVVRKRLEERRSAMVTDNLGTRPEQ